MIEVPKKEWLSKTNYKILSRGAPWKTLQPFHDGTSVAVDVDSLVFMYMRQDWGPKRIAKSLANIYNSYNYTLVYSTKIPKLKRNLYLERSILRLQYNNRDHVRDKAVRYLLTKYLDLSSGPIRIIGCKEADKYCAKRYKIIMTEDVDVFLFGNSSTTILHPQTYKTLRCKDYYMAHGISTHGDFLDVAIAIGTDYNYGIRGIGVKTIHRIIVRDGYKNITSYLCTIYDLNHSSNKWYLDNYLKVLKYFL